MSVVALSPEQTVCLRNAIACYGFPPNYFDFTKNVPGRLNDTKAVEIAIRQGLISAKPEPVKNALSNVLYWGYGTMGIRDTRVSRFRNKVTGAQLTQASNLFCIQMAPSVMEVKKLRLPEFSGLSFVSKVRMFLDPDHSATLDWQIMKIRDHCRNTVLAQFVLGDSTQIRITAENSDAYEAWCQRMMDISRMYFGGRFRAVDVERGLFQLVQSGDVDTAARILRDT